MATKGIAGLAVVLAAAGGILMFAGMRKAPLTDTVRSLLKGDVPDRPTKTSGASTAAAQAALASGMSSTVSGAYSGGGGVTQTSTGTVGSGPHPEVARKALTQLGVPYIWGGSTPKGFDCSGLVQWTLEGLGYTNVPRVTGTQQIWKNLRTIPRSQMAAGDLVFWPGHVAIAINSTQVVHAPRPGSVVRVAPVDEAGPAGYTPTVKRIVSGGKVAAT